MTAGTKWLERQHQAVDAWASTAITDAVEEWLSVYDVYEYGYEEAKILGLKLREIALETCKKQVEIMESVVPVGWAEIATELIEAVE